MNFIKNNIYVILTLLVGIGLSIFAIINIVSYSEKSKTYIETTGTVVDYKYSTSDDGNRLAYIIVEYKVERNSYRLTSISATNHPKRIGTKVKVKYNQDNPSDAIFSNDKTYIILLATGLLFAGFGIYALIDNIKKNR